jgi:hypothetical protein
MLLCLALIFMPNSRLHSQKAHFSIIENNDRLPDTLHLIHPVSLHSELASISF